jgi:hypothetical protein
LPSDLSAKIYNLFIRWLKPTAKDRANSSFSAISFAVRFIGRIIKEKQKYLLESTAMKKAIC